MLHEVHDKVRVQYSQVDILLLIATCSLHQILLSPQMRACVSNHFTSSPMHWTSHQMYEGNIDSMHTCCKSLSSNQLVQQALPPVYADRGISLLCICGQKAEFARCLRHYKKKIVLPQAFLYRLPSGIAFLSKANSWPV